MDSFWIEKAHRYISEHNAFEDVSNITTVGNDKFSIISAMAKINLPGKFIKGGVTDVGVRKREEVHFIFPESFPLEAPVIKLRDDFPRCFPHINPSEKDVRPCIYEGNLSELLQQSEWMNGILNQLADWFEKAASNDLLNYDQGWEPMRNDHNVGFVHYDIDDVLSAYAKGQGTFFSREIHFEIRNEIILTDFLCNPEKTKKAHVLFVFQSKVIDSYVPNTITTLGHLYEYANSIQIEGMKDLIENIDISHINEDKIFVVLCVKRPVNIIGSDSDVEFLNFVISKSAHRNKKGRELKRTMPNCKVGMLSHIALQSPSLLKQVSGTNTMTDETKDIALVGCGSLGSKIGMHLARNGNGPFLCIDCDILMPHNNARHALTFPYPVNKAKLLSLSIQYLSGRAAKQSQKNAFTVDFSSSRMIIDTTASFSVRNFLMKRGDLPPIISCGLYGRGRYGLLLSENERKTISLTDIWSYLYYRALTDTEIHQVLFESSQDNVMIGQSCSSQTMIVDDARISLMAATMSLRIQHALEVGLSSNAEILLTQFDDNYSLKTRIYPVQEFITVQSVQEKEWKVFISESVIEQMRNIMYDKSPNETGGVLLGSVFLYPKTIVITGIIAAPPDSIETPTLFIVGLEGLEKKIKDTEKRTNGKVTYLGTWHSHPRGGKASPTDERTFKKLLFVRNYEPTVCLIITENQVIMV